MNPLVLAETRCPSAVLPKIAGVSIRGVKGTDAALLPNTGLPGPVAASAFGAGAANGDTSGSAMRKRASSAAAAFPGAGVTVHLKDTVELSCPSLAVTCTV